MLAFVVAAVVFMFTCLCCLIGIAVLVAAPAAASISLSMLLEHLILTNKARATRAYETSAYHVSTCSTL